MAHAEIKLEGAIRPAPCDNYEDFTLKHPAICPTSFTYLALPFTPGRVTLLIVAFDSELGLESADNSLGDFLPMADKLHFLKGMACTLRVSIFQKEHLP